MIFTHHFIHAQTGFFEGGARQNGEFGSNAH
jgi:hypothetical protein